MRHCRRAPSVSGSSAASPLPATGGAGLPPLLSRFQLANQPSEDAIRSKRLVPYEVDSATVAWLLAHNQQLSPPVDQHGVWRQANSSGVQTDALSLDTSCLLEDFLRSSRAVGLLNSAVAAPQLGRLRFLSRLAQSTADAEESAESLRNRCDELAKVNADLKRLLVAALGLDLQAQLDRLSSETGPAVRPASRGRVCAAPSWPKSAIASASKPTSGAANSRPARVMIDELAGWRAAAGQLCWGVASARPAAAGTGSSCGPDLAD
uniref:FH2 domain-containing protein n=1 Tax=Macrostomum lignano TaxID=282301 RepID=A0A1I8FMM8_9PLAT